jgi:hypothetical protein
MSTVGVTTSKAEAAPTSHESDNSHEHSPADPNDSNKRRRAEELVEKHPTRKKTKPSHQYVGLPGKWITPATFRCANPELINAGTEAGSRKVLKLIAAQECSPELSAIGKRTLINMRSGFLWSL